MIQIFLESDKFSHKAGVTKHATNTLARKSPYVVVVVVVTVMRVLSFVLHVCMLRECESARVTAMLV